MALSYRAPKKTAKQQKEELAKKVRAKLGERLLNGPIESTELPETADLISHFIENPDVGSQQMRTAVLGVRGTQEHSISTQMHMLSKIPQGNPNAVSENENHHNVLSILHQELAEKTSKIGKGKGELDSLPVRQERALIQGHLDAASSKLYQHLIKHREGDAVGANEALEQVGHHLTDAATRLQEYALGKPKLDENGNQVFDKKTKEPVMVGGAKTANPLISQTRPPVIDEKSGQVLPEEKELNLTNIHKTLSEVSDSYRDLVKREYGTGVISTPRPNFSLGSSSPYRREVEVPAVLKFGRNEDISSKENSIILARKREAKAAARKYGTQGEPEEEDTGLDTNEVENKPQDSDTPEIKRFYEEQKKAKIEKEQHEAFKATMYPELSLDRNLAEKQKAHNEAAKSYIPELKEEPSSRAALRERYTGDKPRPTSFEEDMESLTNLGRIRKNAGYGIDVAYNKLFTPPSTAPAVAFNVKKAQKNIAKKQAKFQTAQEEAKAAEEAKIPPVRFITSERTGMPAVHPEDKEVFKEHVNRIVYALKSGEDVPENSARIVGEKTTNNIHQGLGQEFIDSKRREKENLEAASLGGELPTEGDEAPKQSRGSVFHETIRNQGY
jgi:hypothetical protein